MGNYSKLITLKKMCYQAIMVALSGGVTYCANFLAPLAAEENAVVFGVALIIIKGLENYLKHFKDE